MKHIPTTVVTGSLGAGKTTLIMNLIKQMPKNYKVLWLKNEYGDVNIDSELAKSSNIQSKEILNGCICCVLVGKLHNALVEITEKYELDRLIIETAGTAYPYPIVNEIKKIQELKLDGLIMVVDVLNFEEFGDKTQMARSQGKYIDLIVLNKVEVSGEQHFLKVEDEVFDMYPSVPKVNSQNGFVQKEILLGIDRGQDIEMSEDSHHSHNGIEHSMDVITFKKNILINKEKLSKYIQSLNPSDFFRIKGLVNTSNGTYLLNYVLGRIVWEEFIGYDGPSKITFIGKGIRNIENKINNTLNEISY